MKLIIDALGSDEGAVMVAEATKLAMERRDFDVVLVGPKNQMEPILSSYLGRIEWIDTNEYIANDEHPVLAIRRKKQSSTVLGLQRLNESDCDGFLTAGSTGALLAGGYFITKRIAGIERACLAAVIPNAAGGTVLVDTGANMDTTPEILFQFGVMGAAYMSEVLGRDNPRVGLINVGAEPGKGDKRTQQTYELLKDSDLNFVGNIEARGLLDGNCDVLVADGFSGNVALKTLEGTAKTLFLEIKKGIYSSTKTKIGGALLKGVFKGVASTYDYKAYGGAPLLGTRKPLYKAHGNSGAQTFALAISELLHYASSRVEEKIASRVEGDQKNGTDEN